MFLQQEFPERWICPKTPEIPQKLLWILEATGRKRDQDVKGYLGIPKFLKFPPKKSACPCLSHPGEEENEGQDGSDENPSWNFGHSQISEASFPPEFQHEGESLGFIYFFFFFNLENFLRS